VCLLSSWPDGAWLQAVAAEMNLSETAFLVKNADGFDLRWMTPKVEVDLCGHATLASAHVLWQQGLARADEVIHFSTKSGVLKARRARDDIELDFPLKPEQAAPAPLGLAAALGVGPRCADCCLGGFGRKRVNQSVSVAYQASERGAVVKVRVSQDRAYRGGRAVIVAAGELLARP